MGMKWQTLNAVDSDSVNNFIDWAQNSAANGNAYHRGQGNAYSAVDVANMKLEQLQFEQEAALNEKWWQQRESISGLRSQYEEAGFNPMLAATGGAVSGSGSVDTPTSQPVEQNTEGSSPIGFIGQLLSLFQGFGGLVNQSRDTSASVKLKGAQADEARANADLADKQARQTEIDNMFRKRINEVQLANLKKDTDIKTSIKDFVDAGVDERIAHAAALKSQEVLNKVTANQINELLPYYKSLYEAQTVGAYAKAYEDYLSGLVDQDLLDKGYYDEMIENLRSNTALLDSQEALNTANLGVAESQTELNAAYAGLANANRGVVEATGIAVAIGGIISGVVGSVGNVLDGVAALMGKGAPKHKKIGYN